MSEWKRIDSAPKDGTWILVLGDIQDEGEGRTIAVAQYTEYLNGRKTRWHWQFAWYDGGYHGWVENVSHWMPLPSPPTSPERNT